MMKAPGKMFVLGLAVCAFPELLNAQSSVGIGTNNPNPKSVLHIEAAAGNQGLLLPKLTTAQMQANPFFQSLGMAEKGLLVYDTDRNQMFSWDGANWKSSAKFSLPFVDSMENAPAGTNLMRLVYKGNTGNPVGGLAVENRDPNNGFSPLYLFTNSITQGAADIVVNNNQNQNDAIGAVSNGIGKAGSFRINNAGNANAALFATTNGTVGSSAVHGENTGTGTAGLFMISNANNPAPALIANTNGIGGAAQFAVNNNQSTVAAVNAVTNGKAMGVALRGEATNGGTGVAGFSSGNTFISPAVFGEHSGTGDAAGVFRITNAANVYSALFGETTGSGAAVYGRQTGTGRAGQFLINNPSNAEAAVRGLTDGLGRAGFFSVNNASNGSAAIYANTNGTGNAGSFEVTNSASTVAALNATTNGVAGSVALRGQATNNGTGVAAFSNGNGFISPALYAEQSGTGDAAGVFKLTNASNNYNAVYGETLGGGSTFYALQKGTGRAGQFQINNASNAEASVRGFTDGIGRAGFFTINNASNPSDAVYATTNASGGSAVGADNTANGNAVTLWTGGLRLSTDILNSNGNINKRSAAYEITGGTTFTINFPLNNGETFFFYNNTGSAATVNGISIPANSGRTCIVLSNSLRGM